MILRILIVFLTLIQIDALGQQDNVWNLMILKKENQPQIKDNMANYSPTGFYLYRNCFYDLQFKDKTKRTLRLIDIKPDTLIFVGISEKMDHNPNLASNDTLSINFKSIDKFLLPKNRGAKSGKKFKSDDYYFIFHKSLTDNKYESKFANVFSGGDSKSELVPRLSAKGITYFFEFGGKLYSHSGAEVQTPTYSDEQKIKALNGVMTVLDLLINKRLNVTIH